MAHPSTETQNIRRAFTELSNAVASVESAAQRFIDLGGRDFFDKYLTDQDGNPTTDITTSDLVAGLETLKGILGGLNQQARSTIAKLRT